MQRSGGPRPLQWSVSLTPQTAHLLHHQICHLQRGQADRGSQRGENPLPAEPPDGCRGWSLWRVYWYSRGHGQRQDAERCEASTRAEEEVSERSQQAVADLFIIFVSSYRHAVDGLIRVSKEEGVRKLFNGADWATGRAVG